MQETLNALLDEEADEMVGAERYERTAAREACRSGHYERKLVTTSGEVALDVPKLRGATLLRLRGRGLSGVRLVTGDKSPGMLGALEEVFPEVRHQRCTVRFYRNAFGKVPRRKRTRVAKMLKAIHAQESREASASEASEVADPFESMKLSAAAKVVREGYAETLAYTDFPVQHRARIGTNNAIERLNREIRRRTRVVGTFPDGKSALMPVTARQPMGQRARGILLQDAQARAGERQGLQDEGGGEAGRVQIHRALLQHAKDALIDRL